MNFSIKKSLLTIIYITFFSHTTYANTYPGCYNQGLNNVAIPKILDNVKNRECFSKHLKLVSSTKANFITFDTAEEAKKLTETAKSTATIIAEGDVDGLFGNLFTVVTAVGLSEKNHPGIMTLARGTNYKELSMVAASNDEIRHQKLMKMGTTSALNKLSSWEFEALLNADKGTEQHFHLIGIDCEN